MINIDYGNLIVPKEIDEGIRKLILDIIHKSNFNYKEEEYRIKVYNRDDSPSIKIEVGKRWGHRECPDYPSLHINNKEYGYEVNGFLFHNNSPHYVNIDLDDLMIIDNVVSIYDEIIYYQNLCKIENNEIKRNI